MKKRIAPFLIACLVACALLPVAFRPGVAPDCPAADGCIPGSTGACRTVQCISAAAPEVLPNAAVIRDNPFPEYKQVNFWIP